MPKNLQGPAALVILAIAICVSLAQMFWAGSPQKHEPTGPATIAAPESVEESPKHAPDGPVVQTSAPAAFASNSPPVNRSSQGLAPAPGDFAYYVLALSWSPTYCLEEADPQRDRRQCQAARPYAFVLHGLWPQRERGHPDRCESDNPRVPDSIVDSMLDIMPSRGLVGHQWRKHGSCTGLEQDAYFRASRAAFEAIKIPAEFTNVTNYVSTSPAKVEAAFLKANPGIKPDAVTVTCTRKHLREVRICMSKDFKFRSCGPDVRRDCDLAQIIMPPARGGR